MQTEEATREILPVKRESVKILGFVCMDRPLSVAFGRQPVEKIAWAALRFLGDTLGHRRHRTPGPRDHVVLPAGGQGRDEFLS